MQNHKHASERVVLVGVSTVRFTPPAHTHHLITHVFSFPIRGLGVVVVVPAYTSSFFLFSIEILRDENGVARAVEDGKRYMFALELERCGK